MNRRRWRIIRDYCIGWVLAFIVLSIVRGLGTSELGSLKFDFLSSLMISFTMGPILGIVSAYAQILLEERIYKRMSIQRLLLLRFFFAMLFVLVLTVLAYGVYRLYFGIETSLKNFAFDHGSIAIIFYLLLVDFLFSVFRQVNLMLGVGTLVKLLRGEFYTPREEVRIFMFLDLQASTTLAERLGHLKYSKLIQDCFNDLGVVIETDAEIYQYVGDEAVLTWKLKDGIRNQNCLKAFFSFKQQLAKRENHYQENYACLPFFKAGLHVGTVTVTEVGKYKKEIAYHGDPINTAARIQSQCNVFKEELLISEALMNQVDSSHHDFKSMGSILLKGKEKEVLIYAVS